MKDRIKILGALTEINLPKMLYRTITKQIPHISTKEPQHSPERCQQMNNQTE